MDWLQIVIGFVVGIILPIIFMSYLPNKKFYGWGYKMGSLGSAKGSSYIGKDNWEKLENNLTSSFVAFANGLKEGADSDD